MRRVRAFGSINMNPCSLNLFAWTKDFNPATQHNSSAQVWVSRLSQEYWRPCILIAITSYVGNPICIDATSSRSRFDKTFGHFVRVLIEMDSTQPLNYNVLVEREGFAFFSNIEYENIPVFFSHCKKTGHKVKNCELLRNNNHSYVKTKTIFAPKAVLKLVVVPKLSG